MDNSCKMCLLREMAEGDIKLLEKYMRAIKEEDRVDKGVYEERLAICKQCEKLNAGTCNSCGCYVEIRALGKMGNCPKKKW